jgi:FKBP-type peptidyl-prolyl cis-trans isomerase SlyD
MKITRDTVVALEYTLKNDAGEVIDESGDDPLTYLHGHGQIVRGLEKALEGQDIGASMNVVVKPKDGYGEKKTGKTISVARSDFPAGEEPEVGRAIEAVADNGKSALLWIINVDDESVELSVDHPLAGVTLHFDVKVCEVRKATRDELSHGHAHGPDGHHH